MELKRMKAFTEVSAARRQGGALMIEVLVTIVIVIIGLWGLLEMQSNLHKSEMESYQRTQAVILVNDMASRITTNRANAPDYVTAAPLGVGEDCDALPVSNLQEVDTAEWCNALQGASELQGGTSIGAMVGGRGCVEEVGVGSKEFMVTVVWQGLTPISAPPASVSCGVNSYNEPADSDCVDDRCRRYVTTLVRVAELDL
jgi:type IV pilus assembly protein PilV